MNTQNIVINIAGSEIHGVKDGAYSVEWIKDKKCLGMCKEVLRGACPFGAKYVYRLFQNGYGYIVKRKNRYIPEQEQSWEDVACITAP